MKIFWPPPKIQNFQIPTLPLTLGEGGGVCTMELQATENFICSRDLGNYGV